MDITVNQETYSISQACSLEQMLTSALQLSVNGIAVAVNQEIISKKHWKSYCLKQGDHVTIINATQGG